MSELTGLPYASETEGVCHSCGHDIHTTTLLYCARVLAELKDELHGNVMFLFQPAEEKGTGAKYMIDKGALQVLKPDVFVGLHVSPEFDAGSIGLKKVLPTLPAMSSPLRSAEKAATEHIRKTALTRLPSADTF